MYLKLCNASDGLLIGNEARNMPLPAVPASVTLDVCISVVMPSRPGRFHAEWSIGSHSFPAFRHVISAEFEIQEPARLQPVEACEEEAYQDCIEIDECPPGIAAPVNA